MYIQDEDEKIEIQEEIIEIQPEPIQEEIIEIQPEPIETITLKQMEELLKKKHTKRKHFLNIFKNYKRCIQSF